MDTRQAAVNIGGSFSLTDDESGYWVGHVPIPSWAGLTRSPDLTAYVEIEIPEDWEGGGLPPILRSAFEWFLANEALTVEPVTGAILAACSKLQSDHGEDADTPASPSPHDLNDLGSLIDLRMLYFHNVANGDLPYIGYVFGCKWNREHGLGVLMHGLRPVEAGGADVAILVRVARRDAGCS
jgi:hypothetical protein